MLRGLSQQGSCLKVLAQSSALLDTQERCGITGIALFREANLLTLIHLAHGSSCCAPVCLLAAQPVCCHSCCASPLQPPDDLLSAGQPLLLGGALHSCRRCICLGGSCQLIQNPAP